MPSDRGAQAQATQPSVRSGNDLPTRVVSGLVMAALALGTAWVGGALFLAFWAAAAAIILWEWIGLTAQAPRRAWWIAAGLAYAGITLAAPVFLRSDGQFGFLAVVFLFAIVWATDILGYVVGRLAGGPKLWPAVSPKKTWAGALGGVAGSIVAGSAVAYAGALTLWPAAVLAALLSVASQAGDLMESALKRRFGAKDASRLIPGHGGVMDRLDGFIVAALIAAVIGLARGGIEHPGRGLLAW